MSDADLDPIRLAVSEGRILYGPHARREMAEENPVLLPEEVEHAIISGEVLEYYADDPRGPSYLVFGFGAQGRPIHAVVSAPKPAVFVITAYIPDEGRWEEYRRRRIGGKEV